MEGLMNFIGGPWGLILMLGLLAILVVLLAVTNKLKSKKNGPKKTMKDKAHYTATGNNR